MQGRLHAVATSEPSLSPARAALAAMQSQLADAAAEMARARVPLDRLRAHREAAEGQVAMAARRVAAADAEASTALAAWAKGDGANQPPDALSARKNAHAEQLAAEQVIGAIDRARLEVQADFDKAERAHAALVGEVLRLTLPILEGELATAFSRHTTAMIGGVEAEAACRGLQAVAFEQARLLQPQGDEASRPWSVFAERIGTDLLGLRVSDQSRTLALNRAGLAAATRWQAFLDRLANDASAERLL